MHDHELLYSTVHYYETFYPHKIGSNFDKKILISLNGGGAWTRNFRGYSATLPKTAFNFTGRSLCRKLSVLVYAWFTIAHIVHGDIMYNILFEGFIQSALVEKMVLADDPAGFVDRQLFDFPPERDMYLDDLKVPVPEDIPDLEKVLKVRLGWYRLSCTNLTQYTAMI